MFHINFRVLYIKYILSNAHMRCSNSQTFGLKKKKNPQIVPTIMDIQQHNHNAIDPALTLSRVTNCSEDECAFLDYLCNTRYSSLGPAH